MVVRKPRQRGSIYVLTLLTVAAVGSMVVIGVSVRTATSAESTITEQVNTNNDGIVSAAEYAIAKIESDANWATNAQKGSVFSDFTLGDRTYTSSVLDDTDGSTPTDSTTDYRVRVNSSNGIASESASFVMKVQKQVNYQGLLKNEAAKFYWPMNEASGETVALEAFNGQNGNYQAKSSVGAGQNDEGGVVPVFNDSADHISVPYDSGFDNGKGAFSLWMKHENTNQFKTTGVLGYRFNGTSRVPTLSVIVIARSLIVMVCEDGIYNISKFTYTGSNTILDNTWHHIAINYGSDTGVQIYIDGTLEGANSGNRDGIKSDRGHPLLIGAGYGITMFGHTEDGFIGSLGHLAVFHDPLTSDQIELLSTTKPDANELKLVKNSWAPVYD